MLYPAELRGLASGSKRYVAPPMRSTDRTDGPAMRQRRDPPAHLPDPLQVDLGEGDAIALAGIGQHLIRTLRERGNTVTALVRPTSE